MSTTSGALGRERSGSANTVLFVLLGLLFLFAIVDFGFLYWKNNQDRQAISYTTQIQVLSQALAKFASEAATSSRSRNWRARATASIPSCAISTKATTAACAATRQS